MNLFAARCLVALADASRNHRDVSVLSDPVAMAVKAANVSLGISDVSPGTSLDIREAAGLPTDKAQGVLLRAFWRESIANGFRLHPPTGTRVMINPPAGLPLDSASATLSCQDFLTGCYGNRLKNGHSVSPISRMSMEQGPGGLPGFLDEVVIFWDRGVDINPVLECVASSTVVVLVSPDKTADQNSVWMTWAEFDPSFSKIAVEFGKKFKTCHISTSKIAGAVIRLLGIS